MIRRATPAPGPAFLLWGLLLVFVIALPGSDALAREEQKPFPVLYQDRALFQRAMDQATPRRLDCRVTGLTVPHHLLAADLMAEAFALLEGQEYKRIIIIGPDHYRRGKTLVTTAVRDFETAFGPMALDREAVDLLLADPLISASNLFSHEHAIQALLPFLAVRFPKAKVVPLAVRIEARQPQLDRVADLIESLAGPDTLIVQSTDFSHYLAPEEAHARDRETLRVLSAAWGDDPARAEELVLDLNEPGHIDSKAAQYIQLRVQRRVFQARPRVIAVRNSQAYTDEPQDRTTSYVVQVYSPDLDPAATFGHARRVVFAGDLFLGRGMARVLDTSKKREWLVQRVLEITGGAELVVNLEGVLAEHCPENAGPYTLCMEKESSLAMLKEMNVTVAGLANNHAHDLESEALEDMVQALAKVGIEPLVQGRPLDRGDHVLAAFTDLDNSPEPRFALLREKDLACLDAFAGQEKPVFALPHWGPEYYANPGPREKYLADEFFAHSADAVIGAHSHRASSLNCFRDGCLHYSLGNFIFDQTGPKSTGVLLFADIFEHGGIFLQPASLPNFFMELQQRPLSSGPKYE